MLIDTAGMSQRDVRLTQQLAMVMSGAAKVRAYLVVAATTQRSGLQEIVEAFQDVTLSGCIVTKLDEAPSLGGLLSVIIDKQLPVAYVTDGQRVPEDLAPARADTLVNQGVTLMQPASKNYEEEILALAFGGMMANASL